MQETPQALLVIPVVRVDPLGGFLVVDAREAQVRRYSVEGNLLWNTGGRGGGPGEYQAPGCIERLSNGDIVVADGDAKIVRYDSTGGRLMATYSVPLERIGDIAELAPDTLILTGIGRKGTLLHVWTPSSNELIADFFQPSEHIANTTAGGLANWARVTAANDTVAVIYSISDSIYYFTPAGRRLGAVRIPSNEFRLVSPNVPKDVDLKTWFSTFDMVGDLWRKRDGSLLVLYARPDRNGSPEYHLLASTPRGHLLFEGAVPHLLAFDAVTDSLYFVAPAAEAPNKWVSGILH